MKTKHVRILSIAFSGMMLLTADLATAQTATTETTTTTTAGTISEFSPDTIVVRSETSPAPLRYSYSKTTTYVDEAGAPVSMELVKSGLPVTVYYTKDGDRLVASRVIVRRAVVPPPAAPVPPPPPAVVRPVVPPPVVEEKKTTTTTTTSKEKKEKD